MRHLILKIILVLAVIIVTFYAFKANKTSDNGRVPLDESQIEVVVDQPKWGELVVSPLKVSGKARGTWYFEANLPVKLEDQNGKVLVQKGFQPKGIEGVDWMIEEFVPFSGTLEFSKPETEFGRLVIEKDNPSGLPEHEKSYVIPVRFRN